MASAAQTAAVVVDTSAVVVPSRQSLATSSAPAALQAVAAEVAMPVAVVKVATHSVAMTVAMVPVANAMAAKETAAKKTAKRKPTPPDVATSVASVFSDLAASSQADRPRRPACPRYLVRTVEIPRSYRLPSLKLPASFPRGQ